MEPSKQQLSPSIWLNLPIELVFTVFDHLVDNALSQFDTDPFSPWLLHKVHCYVKHRIEREYRRILFPHLFVVHHGGRHYHQKTSTVEISKGFPRWKAYIDQQAQTSRSTSSNTDNDTVTFYTAPDRGLYNRLARLDQQSHGPVWESPSPYPASDGERMPYINLCLVLQYQSLIGVRFMGNTGVFSKTALQTSTDRLAVRFNATQLIDAWLKTWKKRYEMMDKLESWIPGEGWMEGSQREVRECYFRY